MIKNLSLLLLTLSYLTADSGCPIEIERVKQNNDPLYADFETQREL